MKWHYLQLALPSFDWPCALACPVANRTLTIDFRQHSHTHHRLWAKELSMDAIPVGVASDCLDSFRQDPISIAKLLCIYGMFDWGREKTNISMAHWIRVHLGEAFSIETCEEYTRFRCACS